MKHLITFLFIFSTTSFAQDYPYSLSSASPEDIAQEVKRIFSIEVDRLFKEHRKTHPQAKHVSIEVLKKTNNPTGCDNPWVTCWSYSRLYGYLRHTLENKGLTSASPENLKEWIEPLAIADLTEAAGSDGLIRCGTQYECRDGLSANLSQIYGGEAGTVTRKNVFQNAKDPTGLDLKELSELSWIGSFIRPIQLDPEKSYSGEELKADLSSLDLSDFESTGSKAFHDFKVSANYSDLKDEALEQYEVLEKALEKESVKELYFYYTFSQWDFEHWGESAELIVIDEHHQAWGFKKGYALE